MRHKKDGLTSKVEFVRLRYDEDGAYIPYCSFNVHRGISLRPEVCEQRGCNHYVRLYVERFMYNQQ